MAIPPVPTERPPLGQGWRFILGQWVLTGEPTERPNIGYEWRTVGGVWRQVETSGPGSAPAPTIPGRYPGWAPGMPDKAPAPGMRWQSAGYREGYGMQGWVQVPESQTEAEWIEWQKQRPRISDGQGGIATMDPYVFTPGPPTTSTTPTAPPQPTSSPTTNFTPTNTTAPAPKTEAPYAGNVPVPRQNAYRPYIPTRRWSWRRPK